MRYRFGRMEKRGPKTDNSKTHKIGVKPDTESKDILENCIEQESVSAAEKERKTLSRLINAQHEVTMFVGRVRTLRRGLPNRRGADVGGVCGSAAECGTGYLLDPKKRAADAARFAIHYPKPQVLSSNQSAGTSPRLFVLSPRTATARTWRRIPSCISPHPPQFAPTLFHSFQG